MFHSPSFAIDKPEIQEQTKANSEGINSKMYCKIKQNIYNLIPNLEFYTIKSISV